MSPSAEALAALARRLRGVYDCRVEMTAGESVPLRVDLTADVSRRTAVARDVQSAFFAVFAVMVPLEHIAVTSVRRPRGGSGLLIGDPRLRLAAIRYERLGERLRVSVSLRLNDRDATGVADVSAGVDRLRAGAEAALTAVSVVMGWPQPFSLEDVSLVPTGAYQAVLVRVRVAAGVGGLRLGAALVRSDAGEAAVRAALDAVNRFLPEERRSELAPPGD